MKKLLRYFLSFKNIINKDNLPLIIFFVFVLVTLLINALHYLYPDEYDNILGGFYINQGRLPYTGFFSNHGPVAYFFASIITLFSGDSFVRFRLLLAIAYWIIFLSSFLYIRKTISEKAGNIFLTVIAFLSVGATYFWGHMLLADSLVGYFFLPLYALIFLKFLDGKKLLTRDIIIISTLNALVLLTSLTFIYAVLIVYLFTFIWILRSESNRFKMALKVTLIFASPFLLFLIYLLVTGSLFDYYYQSIYFIKEYYAVSASGEPLKNPLRQAITIISNFIQAYRPLLAMVKDLNLGTPFNPALALSNVILLIYLALNRKFSLFLLVATLLVFLNARTNPYKSEETNYQAIPYDYFSIFNGVLAIKLIWDDLKTTLESNKKVLYSFMLLLLGTYYLFLFIFLFDKGFERGYLKYMGTQSLIYDGSEAASQLNSILTSNDYYYAGPFSYQDHLYINAKLASKYLIVLPNMDRSEKIKAELLNDLKTNKPKIIAFNTDNRIFGVKPGLFLYDFFKENYFTISDLNKETVLYDTRADKVGDYNFSYQFFFDKSRKDEILEELTQKGWIKLKPVSSPIPQSNNIKKL